MQSPSSAGWVTKTITREGKEILARCKHTPNAIDGKEFHCILSPKRAEVVLDEEGSGLSGRFDQSLEPEVGLPGEQADSSPGQSDEPARHSVTPGRQISDPEPRARGGGNRTESSEPPTKLSQSPSEGSSIARTTIEPPTKLSQSPSEGSSIARTTIEPSGILSQSLSKASLKALNKPQISGVLTEGLKANMGDESATEQPGLCATFDEACRQAIGQISKLVFRKKVAQEKICDVLDEKCNRVKKRTLFPLTKADIQRGGEVEGDPCAEGSSCATWGFFRTVIAPFLASLKAEEFQLGVFKDDKDSIWSEEGARLYKLAMSQAGDHQELGMTFLSRLLYKSQLDTLTQLRHSRLELNHQLNKMLFLSVGLSLPSILLSILYLCIHLRWAIKNQNEKRAAKKTDRDHRLLNEYQRSEGQKFGNQ